MILQIYPAPSPRLEIDIEPTDTVDRIKERVEEKEGIPPQHQRLIFSSKQMWLENAPKCR